MAGGAGWSEAFRVQTNKRQLTHRGRKALTWQAMATLSATSVMLPLLMLLLLLLLRSHAPRGRSAATVGGRRRRTAATAATAGSPYRRWQVVFSTQRLLRTLGSSWRRQKEEAVGRSPSSGSRDLDKVSVITWMC